MGRGIVESVMGAIVLLIAGVFLVFAYTTSNLRPVQGYEIFARFNSVEGLSNGGDVRVGGIKVGSVSGQSLDPGSHRAIVTMSISRDVRLPVDTRASVTSDGLLGANYMRLKLGSEKKFVEPGGEIKFTRDVVSLEVLLGRIISLLTEEEAAESAEKKQ